MKKENDEQKERKLTNITIRVTPRDLERIKRACFREEIRPTLFAHQSIMDSLEKLIERQEKYGFKAAQPIL